MCCLFFELNHIVLKNLEKKLFCIQNEFRKEANKRHTSHTSLRNFFLMPAVLQITLPHYQLDICLLHKFHSGNQQQNEKSYIDL